MMRHMSGDEPGATPPITGYVLVYRPGIPNHCPGCGGTHWHIGRHTAECGHCATALPIAARPRLDSASEPVRTGWRARWPANVGDFFWFGQNRPARL